jgi:hypothetical protein
MRVYVIGDSHAAKFHWWWNEHPDGNEYIVEGLGGVSAHSFSANETQVANEAREAFYEVLENVTDKDLILMVLGDGDCRVHFFEHHMRGNIPLQDLIDDTVTKYGAFLLTIGKPLAVLDVPPAQSIEDRYDYLYYGTRDQRAEIARMFNSTMKKFCDENEMWFIELYPYLADERGWLKDEYAHPDGAHILHSAVEFVDEVINDYASKIED